jgi:hypothetical protein
MQDVRSNKVSSWRALPCVVGPLRPVPSMSGHHFDVLQRHTSTKCVIRDIKTGKPSFDQIGCFSNQVEFLFPEVWLQLLPLTCYYSTQNISLGLQHCILLWSAGCLSLEVFSRSSGPHIAFACGLLVPRTFLSVFSIAYCFRVRASCPSKCPLGLHHSILLLSAGCLRLKIFPAVHRHLSLSSARFFVPHSILSGFNATSVIFECMLTYPSKIPETW